MEVGQTFTSFAEFEKCLKDFKEQNNHPLRVFNSQTAKNYNSKHPADHVDEERFLYTYYSVRCVHYGEPRHRGKGVRCHQRSFAKNCPVKITVTFDKVEQKLKIRDCYLEHCHRTGKEIIKHYPSMRRLSEQQEKEIQDVLTLRPNNKLLLGMVEKKFGKFMTLRDIQNLKARVTKKATSGYKDAENTLAFLSNSLLENPDDRGGVAVDENDYLAVVCYQTKHMRQIFKKFPEVLLMDGTYNVNAIRMPLYCFMTEDGFGKGRVVFYAATCEEDATHLQKMVQMFKESNPNWNSIRIVVIDKDFTEWKVLKEELPDATILFCQWHVVKALFKKLCDLDVPKDKREPLRTLLRAIVYSANEVDYTATKKKIFDASSEEFQEYFNKNWEDCQSMWVSYKRNSYLHLANTTNNRLESHNQKLKDLTQRSSTLCEMFQNVIHFSHVNASEYSQAVFTEEFTTVSKFNEDVDGAEEIRNSFTRYAADMLVEQLKLSKTIHYDIRVGRSSEHVVVSTTGTYDVDTENLACTCSFKQTLGLPCRHLFFARSYLHLTTFESTMVADRWLKSYQMLDKIVPQDAGPTEMTTNQSVQIDKLPLKPKEKVTLSQSQKYRKMLNTSEKLAAIASHCGMPEFREKLSTIETIIELWDKNVPFSIEKTDNTTPVSLLEEPPADLPLPNGKTEHSAVETNIGEPIEVSKEHIAVKEHSAVEANIGEPVEVSKLNGDFEASKLNGDRESLALSGEAKNNDQVSRGKAINQAPVETHDNLVIVDPVCEVTCKANDTQTVDDDGRMVFEESEVMEKLLGVGDISPQKQVDVTKNELSLSLLMKTAKVKEHIKPKGRPKHTGKVWPRKRKINENKPFCKKAKKSHTTPGPCTENVADELNRNVKARDLFKAERQKLRNLDTNKIDRVCIAEDMPLTKVPATTNKWIDDLLLLQEDQQIILSQTAWINDRIIDACQRLLKQDIDGKDIGGFQSVCLGQIMYFSVEDKQFIQILNTGHSHWVTICTVGTNHPMVNVYDSKYVAASTHLSAQIACLLMTQHAEITINFVDVVKQAGSYDCGLYAIAYAAALAHGNDPAAHHYCQEKMRPHLRKCLMDRKLKVFPHKTICPSGNFRSEEKLPVHCLCRMPEIKGQPMVECSSCKEWYHFVCEKVTSKSLTKNADWYCTNCTTK